MRGGGAFTLSLGDVVVGSLGAVVSAVLCILLWNWVAGPSRVDVTNLLIEAVGVAGMSLTSTNYDRQSAALLQVLYKVLLVQIN